MASTRRTQRSFLLAALYGSNDRHHRNPKFLLDAISHHHSHASVVLGQELPLKKPGTITATTPSDSAAQLERHYRLKGQIPLKTIEGYRTFCVGVLVFFGLVWRGFVVEKSFRFDFFWLNICY